MKLWTDEDDKDLDCCLEAERKEDLLSACLAIEGVKEEIKQSCLKCCQEWAALVLANQEKSPTAALRAVLGDQLGFHGELDNYYHPTNSHLSHVIETRKGLPILLSVIWIHVGTLADIPVDGVGMPGHFIVRVTEEQTHQFVDPFQFGKTLSQEDCHAIVRRLSSGQLPWQESFLAPTPTTEIIERVIRNLLSTHAKRKEPRALYRTLRFYQALRPDLHQTYLQCGNIAAALEDNQLALESFQEFVNRFPEHPAIDQVKETIDTLSQSTPYLN